MNPFANFDSIAYMEDYYKNKLEYLADNTCEFKFYFPEINYNEVKVKKMLTDESTYQKLHMECDTYLINGEGYEAQFIQGNCFTMTDINRKCF